MFSQKKIGIIIILFSFCLLFSIASSVISFEDQSQSLARSLQKDLKKNGKLSFSTKNKAKVSIFPWVGLTFNDVTIKNNVKNTNTKVSTVNIKFDLYKAFFGKFEISAISIEGLMTNYSETKIILDHIARKNIFQNITMSDGIDVELRNVSFKYNINKTTLVLKNVNARIIGFNFSNPFTINLKSDLLFAGRKTKLENNSMISILPSKKIINLTNSHSKITLPLKNGSFVLIIDNNLKIDNLRKIIYFENIAGYANNAQFIGELKWNLSNNITTGHLSLLPFSFNNLIHSLDLKSKLAETRNPHNTKGDIYFDKNFQIIKSELNIDNSSIKTAIDISHRSHKDIFITSNIDYLSLDRSSIYILDFLDYLGIKKTLSGKVKISNAKFENLDLKAVTSKFEMKDNYFYLDVSSKNFYNGKAKLKLEEKDKETKIRAKISQSQINPLFDDLRVFKNKIGGSLNVDMKLKYKNGFRDMFNDMQKVKGTIDFNLENGFVYAYLNPSLLFLKILDNNSNKAIVRPTVYENISSKCEVSSAILKCTPIKISTPFANLIGENNIDLRDNKVSGFISLKKLNKKKTIPLALRYSGTIFDIKTEIDLLETSSSMSYLAEIAN
ncbi:MAG: hypothetical protein VX335_01270 [Pseudomonadota bacterium]|nr:hypothetical protein [Pseudomonadota bacterium]